MKLKCLFLFILFSNLLFGQTLTSKCHKFIPDDNDILSSREPVFYGASSIVIDSNTYLTHGLERVSSWCSNATMDTINFSFFFLDSNLVEIKKEIFPIDRWGYFELIRKDTENSFSYLASSDSQLYFGSMSYDFEEEIIIEVISFQDVEISRISEVRTYDSHVHIYFYSDEVNYRAIFDSSFQLVRLDLLEDVIFRNVFPQSDQGFVELRNSSDSVEVLRYDVDLELISVFSLSDSFLIESAKIINDKMYLTGGLRLPEEEDGNISALLLELDLNGNILQQSTFIYVSPNSGFVSQSQCYTNVEKIGEDDFIIMGNTKTAWQNFQSGPEGLLHHYNSDFELVDELSNCQLNSHGSDYSHISETDNGIVGVNLSSGPEGCANTAMFKVSFDFPSSIYDDPIKAPKLNLLPNPTSSMLTIEADADVAKIILFDSFGKKVIEYENRQTLDVTPLDSGIYTVSVLYKNGSKAADKFVKI